MNLNSNFYKHNKIKVKFQFLQKDLIQNKKNTNINVFNNSINT